MTPTDRRTVFCSIVAGAWLSGCRSEPAPAALRAAADSGPATPALNDEPRWSVGEAWAVPNEPRLIIGVRDGDEEYQFSDISAAARQSDGDLVVADAGAGTVRLYGPDGVFRRLLGGAGAGPGEFRNPTQIVVRRVDSIFVWDDGPFRLTKFDSEGNFVGVQTFRRERIAEAAAPPLYPGSALILRGGELLVRLVEKSRDPPGPGWFRQRSGALRVSADLGVIDTVMFFGDVEQVSVDSPWGPLLMSPAFARNTSIAVQPTEARVCIGEQEGAEVRCFGRDGSTTVVRWQAPPIPVRTDEREMVAWRNTTLELYGQKLSADDARRLVSQIPVPAERPPYSGLVLDGEGNLWVERGPIVEGGSDATEYLVFDLAGRLLGPISIPPVRILEIGADYVIGVHQDALEIQTLQVFDLLKPRNP